MREGGGRGSAPFVMRVWVIWVGCGGVALCLRWGLPGRGLFSACPVGTIAQSLAAGLPYGWGVALVRKTTFSFAGKRGILPCSWFFACPAGAKTTFSFAGQKKKRFWTPKKKRWTGGNDYGLRYNRTLVLCYYGIPWVKDFGVSFCFRRPAFERPVGPFAPLPLSGWNTGNAFVGIYAAWVGGFGRGGRMLPGWVALR